MRLVIDLYDLAASYAAAATGYLTGVPGVVAVVSGPGLIHAVAGLANAKENCWPIVCLGGSSESGQKNMGAFQEAMQLEYARPACKYICQAESAARIPFHIENAFRWASGGRPGACYIDLPGDVLRESLNEEDIYYPPRCLPPALTQAPAADVTRAVQVLKAAKSPLIVIGKGAAMARAESVLLSLVEATNMPFLPTPMGKGMIPDDHPQCIAPARSTALGGADVVVLVGCRLNWMLHYGRQPRYQRDVKFIHIELMQEEVGHSVQPEVALVGHATAVVAQLTEEVRKQGGWAVPGDSSWWAELKAKVSQNEQSSVELALDRTTPMSYYW